MKDSTIIINEILESVERLIKILEHYSLISKNYSKREKI